MHARSLTDPDVAAAGVAATEADADAPGATGLPGEPSASDALATDGAISGVGRQVRAIRELFGRPLTPYYLLVGIMSLLLMLGLVMVLSTGSIRDLTNGQSPYSDFVKQLLGVLVGIPLTWVAARSSPRLFRAAAYPLVAISIVGLALSAHQRRWPDAERGNAVD